MPRGRRTVSTRHGFDMHLTMSELVDREIYCRGVWEPLATQLFARVLRPGDAVADVGANIGWFSLLAARLTGPRGRVHAFEASRPTFALLGDNLSLNAAANVEPHLVAVGESAGQTSIIQREAGNRGADCRKPRSGRTRQRANGKAGRGAGPGAAAADQARHRRMGGQGPARCLGPARQGRPRPDLLFEFTPDFLRAAGDDPAELLRWLAALDYRLSMITPAGLEPLDAGCWSGARRAARTSSSRCCAKPPERFLAPDERQEGGHVGRAPSRSALAAGGRNRAPCPCARSRP